MSVSGKRMCQLDKNISDEIYKISKRDPAEIRQAFSIPNLHVFRAKQGGDEADETDGKRSNLFKKPPGTKQSIKDILKRINDKNLKGLHHDMHKVVHKQPEVVQVSDFIIAKKDFSKNDLL